MAHDRCNYFSFWSIFCPFTPQTSPKKSKLKKKKNEKTPPKKQTHLDISSFYASVPKIMIMIIYYTLPQMWGVADVIIIFHFGQFFALLPP